MESILQSQSYSTTQQVARRIVFAMLRGLDRCGLVVEELDQSHFFGVPDADLQARVRVNDGQMYVRLLSGGSIGIAESYVEGEWQSPDLTSVIRVFARNLPTLEKFEKRLGWITYPLHKLHHLLNRNTRSGSRTNIAAHYDLGNEMYELILDAQMQYSSAIYPSPGSSLDQAQEHKLRTICERLELKHDDHLLEIGTGWGGLACYAASHYGCRVTTTTLSKQQFAYAQDQVKKQGLQDRVTLLLKDYRDLEGQYDKLVSVEMIEAVGHEYMPAYFEKLEQLLKPNGRMLIQAITIADQAYDNYRRSVDFIQKYIFPGGCLPSLHEMCRHLRDRTSMTVSQIQEYGIDYADTLAVWTERFNNAAGKLEELGYDSGFRKLWNYYFAYCEGGFREGCINLIHFEAVKPGTRQRPGFGYV